MVSKRRRPGDETDDNAGDTGHSIGGPPTSKQACNCRCEEHDSNEKLGVGQRNANTAFPLQIRTTSAKPYSAVQVAQVIWESDHHKNAIYRATVALQHVFRDLYGYDAGDAHDIFQIPSRDLQQELDNYIFNVVERFERLSTCSKKLLIVYYTGHAGYANSMYERDYRLSK